MDKKILNITAGRHLNEKMKNDKEIWVPFNEDMSVGECKLPLFSESFLKERSSIFKVTLEEYVENLKDFLEQLKKINEYELVNLWFGDDFVCLANSETVYNCLIQYGYKGKVVINIVDEISLFIKKRFLGDFSKNPYAKNKTRK